MKREPCRCYSFAQMEDDVGDFQLIVSVLQISSFVYWNIRRCIKTTSVDDRLRSGRPRVTRVWAAVKAFAQRICSKSSSCKESFHEKWKFHHKRCHTPLKILGLWPTKGSRGHWLTVNLQQIGAAKSKILLEWHANFKHRLILFMHKKNFTMEEKVNHQNDHVCARNSRKAAAKYPKLERSHHPASKIL